MKYEVIKVYNNNVVLAKQDQRQVVLVSKGIGFGKKPGDVFENDNIEKVYHELNPLNTKPQIQALTTLDEQVDYATVEFITIAEDKLGSLGAEHEATIKDHIAFAIARLQMGLTIENPFLEEVKTLYRLEYIVAGIARDLIKKRTNIDLGDEEQGFIALHLHAAKNQHSINETIRITRSYKACMEIIQEVWGVAIPLKHAASKQLLNSLKLLIYYNKANASPKLAIPTSMIQSLSKSYEAASKITAYLAQEKDIVLKEDEVAYLTIDIEKLMSIMTVRQTLAPTTSCPTRPVVGSTMQYLAELYIDKLGGADNIISVESCATRLRIHLKDSIKIDEEGLKSKGARAILKPFDQYIEVVLGTTAERLAKQINERLR